MDMGCGTGWTSILFAKKGYIVDGQDISGDMIELANKNKNVENLSNVNFFVSDYETLNSSDKYDCAVFYDSLHHAEDEKSALKAAFNILKKNGTLIALEPGEGHSKATSSIEASEKYGVTEKDMPPYHIINVGKEVGFTKYKVFPRHSIHGMNILFDSEISDFSDNLFNSIKITIKLILRDIKRAVKHYKTKADFLKTSNIVMLIK